MQYASQTPMYSMMWIMRIATRPIVTCLVSRAIIQADPDLGLPFDFPGGAGGRSKLLGGDVA